MAGRFELIECHHWNFVESKEAFGFSLDEFLVLGGYPEAAKFKTNFARWKHYLLRVKTSSPKILPLCPALHSHKMEPEDFQDANIRGHAFEACVGAELTKL